MDDGLPHPSDALTLAEIDGELERVIGMLQRGGAVIVLANDLEQRLGVLARDPAVLGDAQVAQLIDAGHLPPIAELLAMDDRGSCPDTCRLSRPVANARSSACRPAIPRCSATRSPRS